MRCGDASKPGCGFATAPALDAGTVLRHLINLRHLIKAHRDVRPQHAAKEAFKDVQSRIARRRAVEEYPPTLFPRTT